MTEPRPAWWSNAVFYQVYPRSFRDGNGDGIGDLDGLTSRLDYLMELGVQALWLSPIMVSPMADHGYDVADPRDVDPIFGGLPALERLVDEAHSRGLKVTMDLVPNHTSAEHPWFVAALASGPGSPERARYLFLDGRGPDGSLPPNNWPSIFGGPAWHRVTEADGTPGQWYLHLFAPEQPDLNWENPEVFEDLEKTLRFWLDRGVDGFRIDVAHGMAKPLGLPDMSDPNLTPHTLAADDLRFNDNGVHRIHRGIRRVLDDYPHATTIGEIWVSASADFAKYLRPDELHLGFNFALVRAEFAAQSIRVAIESSLAAVEVVAAPPTWTLSNHDVVREVTRYGDGARGVARARAMALVMLALPGTVFVYNGEELGLPNVDDLPEEVLQDPTWERSGHTDRGRDGCRVPMPWQGDQPPFGFSVNRETWLPIPPEWATLTVQAQLTNPASTLSLYRRAIEMRTGRSEFDGPLTFTSAEDGVLSFVRSGGLRCVLNTGDDAVVLPDGHLLLASGPLVDNTLPPDTAVWVIPVKD